MWAWRTAAAALVVAAGLTGGCAGAAGDPDCPGGKATKVIPGSSSGRPAVADRLWVADGAGSVRSIGETGGVLASATVAGAEPRWPPALIPGDEKLWVFRYDTGDVALIDPATANVLRRANVEPARPLANNQVLFAHGYLWIVQPGQLWRISPAGKVSRSALPAGFGPWATAVTGRWLWLGGGNRLLRIDPASPAAVTEVAVPEKVGELAYAGDGFEATGINSPTVRRLDPDTGAVVGEITLSHGEQVLALAGGWAIGNCGNVVRLADRLTVRISEVSQGLPSVAALGDLWVGDEITSEIVRIDGESGHVLARMPFPAADPDDPAFSLIAGPGSVWVVDGGVARVDPVTNTVTRILPAGPSLNAVAF